MKLKQEQGKIFFDHIMSSMGLYSKLYAVQESFFHLRSRPGQRGRHMLFKSIQFERVRSLNNQSKIFTASSLQKNRL